MELKRENLGAFLEWEKVEVTLPQFNVEKMLEETKKAPTWVHFGAGELLRSFVASLQQRLLNGGNVTTGLVVVEPYDEELIPLVYTPYDNLILNVTLEGDGRSTREIIASVAESFYISNLFRLREIFKEKSLQMVTFDSGFEGCSLRGEDGEYSPEVAEDFETGLTAPKTAVAVLTSLLYARFQEGATPLAVVSLDDISKNGAVLQEAVLEMARSWESRGLVTDEFLIYILNRRKVSFPWTMVEKNMEFPLETVEEELAGSQIEGMASISTEYGGFFAAFSNSERSQYLVIENSFPNGRPPLELAGVHFTKRSVVNKAVIMKETACLHPLETALGIFGNLMGYEIIADEMNDPRIFNLVHYLGAKEGLPVVASPEVIDPQKFLYDMIVNRFGEFSFTNSCENLTYDLSECIGSHVGTTIKAYVTQGKGVKDLVAIPLVIAGWFRYLLAVNDNLEAIECRPDPLLEQLQEALSTVKVGDPTSYTGQLKPLLRNKRIFHVNLVRVGLAPVIETMFCEMLTGKGAVGHTLTHYVKEIKLV